MYNDNFYPTPENLSHRLLDKVDFSRVKTILEPSAGKGDLLYAINSHKRKIEIKKSMGNINFYNSTLIVDQSLSLYEVDVIEIDSELQSILRGKNFNIVDTDFLKYSGGKHYDLLLANFPFSDGEKHLLKAIDVIYHGQIVCLVNAETIKNPFSNIRKELISKLDKLGATIEYIQDAFVDAERKTGVECALIYISREYDIENDLFSNISEEGKEELGISIDIEKGEVSTINKYKDLVASYNRENTLVTDQLLAFYKNYKYVSNYLDIEIKDSLKDNYNNKNLTSLMREKHNEVIKIIKSKYWKKVIELPEVDRYLTSDQRGKISIENRKFCTMEFTEKNIRQFVLNLMKEFPKAIDGAINLLFEKFTSHAVRLKTHGWGDNETASNIHYFNAWKTNSGYKVNKKVILPINDRDIYDKWYKRFSLCDYGGVATILEDLEKVMSYFKPSSDKWESIKNICIKSLNIRGVNRNIDTEFFKISFFKKGTMHITFKDLDLLRRFNITACKNKDFLPFDYAYKGYDNLSEDEKNTVDSFEDKISDYKVTSDPVIKNLGIEQLLLHEKY